MSPVKLLTMKQKRVLDFIHAYRTEHDVSPTLREIASFLGTTNISTAQYFVEQIKARGHILKTVHASRSIPLLGTIAAGKPIEAIETTETISVPAAITLNSAASYYALKVRGDSMIDMGVLDGDIVLIQHQLTAENGDVVVAMVDGGATLKVLKRNGDRVILEARNPVFAPIVPENLDIRGRFVGLIRSEN